MNNQILSDNWFLQSSEKLSDLGEKISTLDFSSQGWYPVTIPGTVVSGLVENMVYDDPYYGLNMQSIPGFKHDKKTHFSFHPMPDDSPFRKSWWYRNEFTLDDSFSEKRVWLDFRGINYCANINLNGRRIAGADYIIGSFRRYDIDVTNFIRYNEKNVLAIEVFAPQPDDLSITFIDWGPVPSDDSMGIWQPVSVYHTGAVAIKHPFVRSKLDVDTLNRADLLINAELVNTGKESITGILEGTIEEISFKREIKLSPFEKREVTLTPEEFPQLTIQNCRVWWLYQLGKPELYALNMQFTIDEEVSDSVAAAFGIRDIRSRINEHGARQFTINGKDILIRGSAWTPDLMLRQSKEQDEIDIAFLKNMNLNAFRMEGKLASDYFWDICDREGILVLAGWPCCTHWEKWDRWKPGDMIVAQKSLRSQMKRLRNHPSFIAWFYGSDFPPPEKVERMYLEVLKETYEELPAVSNASARPSVVQGETGVKMSGPYTYVPPVYWYDSEMRGCAEGFNTETGPDVSIPVIESLRKMLPEDQLLPGSKAWNHHAGLAFFTDTEIVNNAVKKRYGKPVDIDDFAMTAQVLSYECWRAIYEAYARNYPKGTGVIGWMHNSAWPSVIWQLYDYYLQPTGGFYGAKKACEPLHVQYSYDDASIWVVNNGLERYDELEIHATVMNVNSEKKFDCIEKVKTDPYARVKVTSIPEIEGLTPVYFLFLLLKNEARIVSRNCYWLPTTKDVFAKKSTKLIHYPLKKHADMSPLRSLPKAEIETLYNVKKEGKDYEIRVSVTNISDTIAFFLRAQIFDKEKNDLIAPVYWSDNCITLLPSEQLTITGLVPKKQQADTIKVVVKGWNL